MGDASFAPQTNQPMQQDMGMPNMNVDGNQNMQDTSMMTDPNMDINEQPPMDDQNMGMENINGEQNIDRTRKEIQKNIGKGCADFRNYQGQDKDDLSKWIEGMLDSILDDSDAGIGEESEGNEPPMDESIPQMESVIFTKKQINKLNEEFGIENLSSKKEDEMKPQKKQNSKKNKNTPFSNPKLNIK